MITRSAHIVQSQIIGLGTIPFKISEDRTVRSPFSTILRSPNCFTDMRTSITDPWRGRFSHSKPVPPLPDKPFLRSLGQMVFNTRSARFSDTFERGRLAERLGQQRNYWDKTGNPEQFLDPDYELKIFGYDPTLEDQRMNHLYFELRRPLFLRASFDNKVVADGRVYVHLYPSGFLIILLAVTFKQAVLKDWISLQNAILEIRPWRSNNKWIWRSKLGSGKLAENIDKIVYLTQRSICSGNLQHHTRSRWYTALKLVTDAEPQLVANGISAHRSSILEFDTYTTRFLNIQDGQIRWSDSGISYKKSLIATDQGIVCTFSITHNRRSALRIFSKVHALYEFVALKKRILQDYAAHLRSEITILKEYRRSTTRKFTKEDIRRLSVFDPQLPRYLLALDNHTLNASPYFRRIYSFMSKDMGFDELRNTTLELVKEWESEVEQWDHSIVVLWKQIVSPLRSLLGSG